MKKISGLFLLIALISISCSKKQVSDKIFRYNESQGIENLDPVMASNYQTIWPLQQSLEGLMEYTQDMQLITSIARSYSIDPDGLTYTFILNKNVFFHDDDCFPGKKGREVNSKDFKYCFERVCDPRTKTRGSWLFRDRIKGAVEYINSIKDNKFDVKDISGLQCPDDTTLVITLTKPFAPFLSILTMPYSFVYPKEAVDFYKENFGYHPVGTGPFKFVSWDFDKLLVFEKNPAYWKKNKTGAPMVYLDGFEVTFTRSNETEYLDFTNGKLDYYSPSPEVLTQVLDDNGKLRSEFNFDYIRQPWLNTVYIGIQLDKDMPGGKNNPLTDNKKLRQALNYAIDRERIIKYVLKFKGHPAVNGPIPIGMPGFSDSTVGYKYDKDKAVQLLKEAGYPEGKGLSFKMTITNEETQKLIGEAVQSQLRDIGVDAQLDFVQGSTMRSMQVGGELAIYELGLKETDFVKRKALYNQMENIVIDEAPWIFLLYNEIVYFKSKRIKDMYIDGLNTLVLKWSKIE